MGSIVKIIGLMPARNEEWVIRHSLACLSGFCDVIIVSDQASEDRTREICASFPKVQILDSPASLVCEQARWRLLDAARQYDGFNLHWWNDADEFVSPVLATRFVETHRDQLAPGTAVECLFYHLWRTSGRIRNDLTNYRPHWKAMARVDDRQRDYDRRSALPLHQPRVAVGVGEPMVRAKQLPVFHAQFLVLRRDAMKQAWYRCREWIDGAHSAPEINALYASVLPPRRVKTMEVPAGWVEAITFPDQSIDDQPTWQEFDILRWFEERGVVFFEPLEIWHLPQLRQVFIDRVGRPPRPDRSYLPSWPARTGHFFRKVLDRAQRLGARGAGTTESNR